MSSGRSAASGRRRATPWRPFLFLLFAVVAAAAVAAGPVQEPTAPVAPDSQPPQGRILDRQIRITHAETGELRVIEFLRLTPPPAVMSDEAVGTLPLLRLQAAASGLRGLAGNVAPERVERTATGAALALATPADSLPAGRLEIAIEYRLPGDAPSLVLAAEHPVDELIVLIDKGGIEARLDPRLEPDGEEGSRAQPIVRHHATNLASGTEIILRLHVARVEWRERIAVLAAACLAAALASLVVIRRERRERSAPAARPEASGPS